MMTINKKQKKIILGVCSSIATYKACEIVRSIRRQELPVQVILTSSATRFVSSLTFSQLSGHPCYVDDWQHGMLHIDLKNEAGLYIIAPATANMLGKMANGIADDLLSSSYLTMKCLTMVAPAMNPNMWQHPATQRNIQRLREDGVMIIEPQKDQVLCGDYGLGKLASVEVIVQKILNHYSK